MLTKMAYDSRKRGKIANKLILIILRSLTKVDVLYKDLSTVRFDRATLTPGIQF